MANRFSEIAKKVADNNSFILQGREKLGIDEVIARYPDGVTVIGVDLLKGQHGEYAAAIFAEEEGFYFNGGKAFTDIAKEWANGYKAEGETYADMEALTADLTECGGVKMKFEKTRTQSGNNFTKVEVVE